MTPTDEKPVNGKNVVMNEADNYVVCMQCGQAIDRRNMQEVAYHSIVDHIPLPLNS